MNFVRRERASPDLRYSSSIFSDWHNSALAWVVLFLSVLVSIFAWHFSCTAIEQTAQARFEAKIIEKTDAIVKRMDAQQVALKGGVGLFSASNHVSRDEWRRYYLSLNADLLLPGLQGFGYSKLLKPDMLKDHVESIRGEGYPTYKVHPTGTRNLYSSVVYLEPFDARNRRAFGYDMFSERTRRTAMERARDTGQTAVSGLVKLLQETNTDVQNGFLMYIPHFKRGMPTETVAQRRAAIQGFVYSPFRAKDLMNGIIGLNHGSIRFQIYDGTEISNDTLLYDSQEQSGADAKNDSAGFSASRMVAIHGHPWRILFSSQNDFISTNEKLQPILITALAIIIDALLFCTILSMSSQKQKFARLIKRRTDQLSRAKRDAEKSAARETELRVGAERAHKRVEDANKGLTRFASIVAHDLRAPLKRLESFVEILEQEYQHRLDFEGRDVVQRISKNSERMRLMLDALHDYTKISNSSKSTKSASLSQTVHEVLDGFESELDSANVSVDMSDEFWVRGDTYILQHVVQNLISNSIKFRSEQPLKIAISAAAIDARRILLTVEDNGIGIEKEFARKVFDMFTRLHTEDEYEGTGIGLAVCKKIMVDHGGHISIDTRYTSGTRMQIFFERVQEPALDSVAIAA